MATVPYATATSGDAARKEIRKTLRLLGCSRVGLMDDHDDDALIVAFTHRGRNYQLRASAKGWATMYLNANPWSYRRRGTREKYEAKWLAQGRVAVNSVLRDWIKGQVTAVEMGLLPVEHAFMPLMLAPDGRTVPELIEQEIGSKLLPPGSEG